VCFAFKSQNFSDLFAKKMLPFPSFRKKARILGKIIMVIVHEVHLFSFQSRKGVRI